uniref:Uncharacterized protein n=1 Tax=Rhizophora mucronata TaxID=61149 RepID=A0A2P2MEI3_RHIMU
MISLFACEVDCFSSIKLELKESVFAFFEKEALEAPSSTYSHFNLLEGREVSEVSIFGFPRASWVPFFLP